jgi:Flp pilus assembly pilin Flp
MFMFCRLLWSRSIFPLRRDDRGATAVEYGLMVVFISAVIVGAVTALGLGVLGLFGTIPPGL